MFTGTYIRGLSTPPPPTPLKSKGFIVKKIMLCFALKCNLMCVYFTHSKLPESLGLSVKGKDSPLVTLAMQYLRSVSVHIRYTLTSRDYYML